jgi:5-hydroxyisourate hydrolase-like protein (transthyretin family)
MISNHAPQSIFYTLTLSTISTITALLLTSCGGGSSSSSSPVETATVAAISGVLKQANGVAVTEADVQLDDLTKTKVLTTSGTTDKTDTDGKYSVQPPKTGDYQLIFTKDDFATQYKLVTVGEAVTPTIMKEVGETEATESNTARTFAATSKTGGIALEIPNTTDAIKVSLTLLEGAEIPSTLPVSEGNTLLPVGALSMDISPSTATLSASITASVPAPSIFQNTGREFTVHFLNNGKWEDHTASLKISVNETIDFKIAEAGTYMVMTEVADITADSDAEATNVSEVKEPVGSGQILTPSVENKIVIDTTNIPNTVPEKAKKEITSLISSLLEQQNGTSFGTQDLTVAVPSVVTKQSAAKLAAKLVCTSTITTKTTVYVFIFDLSYLNISGLGIIKIPVNEVVVDFNVSCTDDGTGLGTGGTGSTG